MDKAILVVSFGTTHEDTRIKTIEAIENKFKKEFTDYIIYRAWTSSIIRKRVKKNLGLEVFSVREAMLKMKDDGIKKILVVPTHIINGIENDNMIADVNIYSEYFDEIKFSRPLLSIDKDYENFIKIYESEIATDINSNFGIDIIKDKDTALVFMGHGTSHYVNSAYAALDYRFKEQGFSNVYIACVEAYPEIDVVVKLIGKSDFKKIILLPLMIVAGEHAKEDMNNDWKSLFESKGYEVHSLLKGLGEYEAIQNTFIYYAKEEVFA